MKKYKHYPTSKQGIDAFSKGHEVRGITPRRHFRHSLYRKEDQVIKVIDQKQQEVKAEGGLQTVLMPVMTGIVAIKTVGVEQSMNFLRKQAKNRIVAMNAGLKEGALILQREVKESIAGRRVEPRSVDTGRLLGSIRHELGIGWARVYTDLDYAKFLEFGTSEHYVEPVSAKALHWKVSKIKPKLSLYY